MTLVLCSTEEAIMPGQHLIDIKYQMQITELKQIRNQSQPAANAGKF